MLVYFLETRKTDDYFPLMSYLSLSCRSCNSYSLTRIYKHFDIYITVSANYLKIIISAMLGRRMYIRKQQWIISLCKTWREKSARICLRFNDYARFTAHRSSRARFSIISLESIASIIAWLEFYDYECHSRDGGLIANAATKYTPCVCMSRL